MSEPVGTGPRTPRELAIPDNSHKNRESPASEPQEKIEKIVVGTVTVKKKPWYQRAVRSMVADDAQTIGEFLLTDIFLPNIKNMIRDIVVGGIDRSLYGSSARGGRGGGLGMRGTQSSIRTKYENMAAGTPDRRPQLSHQARASHDFREVILTDRAEAVSVVEALIARIERYGRASVADFYEYLGLTGDYADQNWGWYDLSAADVQQQRGGWLIVLPQTELLRR